MPCRPFDFEMNDSNEPLEATGCYGSIKLEAARPFYGTLDQSEIFNVHLFAVVWIVTCNSVNDSCVFVASSSCTVVCNGEGDGSPAK